MALAQHGTISESANGDGLILQIHADRAELPEEAQKALWSLRDFFSASEGSVDVQVQIAPLIARKPKLKTVKPKARKAAKRKR